MTPSPHSRLALVIVVIMSASTPCAASPRPDPTQASPSAPRAASAPAAPSSATVADPGVGDWRAANRQVREAGGWRVLMREASPSSASPAASKPSALPALPPHSH